MAIAVTDLGDAEDSGTDDSSFSFASFGAEASDRYLIALITAEDGASVFSVSTVTIGGVSASISAQSVNDSGNTKACIAIALVPTGASGTVDVVWTEAITSDQVCTLLRATGLASATAYDIAVNSGSTSSTTSNANGLDWPAGGLVVAVAGWGTPSAGAWTNVSGEDSDMAPADGSHQHLAGSEVKGAANTNVTITATFTSSAHRGIAAASFSPATGYTLTQDGGSFTLTGGTNTLTAQRKLVTSGGSFSLTGGDVTFRKGFTMVASGGSYSLTGGSAGLLVARKLTADGGAYTLTGGTAGLLAGRKLAADGGDFTLTGGQASLLAQRVLDAGGAVYSLDGGDATLLVGRKLAALGGSFELVGGDVEFTYDSSGPAEPEVIWGYRRRKRVKAQPPGKVVYQGVSQEWDDDEAVILLLH